MDLKLETPSSASGTETTGAMVLANLCRLEVDACPPSSSNMDQRWCGKIVDSLEDLRALLASQDSVHALVCYSDPKESLEILMEEGNSPSNALLLWQADSEAMLRLYHQYAKRISLVTRDALMQGGDGLLQALRSRTGIALSQEEVEQVGACKYLDQRNFRPDPTCQLMALEILNSSVADRIVNELEASSLPGRIEEAPLERAERLYHEYVLAPKSKAHKQRSIEVVALQTELETLRNENASVIAQLMRTQEEFEKTLLEQSKTDSKLRELQRRLTEHKTAVRDAQQALHATRESLEAEQKRARKAATASKEAISTLRKELELKAKALAKIERKAVLAQSQLEAIQGELRQIYGSRSWKVTAPLRSLVRALSLRRAAT